MYRFFLLSLFLAVQFIATLSDTPHQIVTKYKNYYTICSGLGYKEKSCASRDVVAFHAKLRDSISNLGSKQPVKFDTVMLNEGSGYDVKTGKFTATEDGVYSFSWNVLVYSGKEFHTEIVKNGNAIAYNYANGRIVKSGYYLSSSSTVNIKMKKGEQVWVTAHGNHGRFLYGGIWPNFSGFKL
ncbi:complement C1q tumor necrosis factor-related protein 3-like [Ostrea edulis]|uniref:complement C1q tumor necrosis factor-related protein 3-like n=1 Tax=Ostrea edulis TaxID=37623 RepID=UPI0024AF2544|nr:complement C1q tumor necrosis factor-related protein 3-like [Ostrea edulis]